MKEFKGNDEVFMYLCQSLAESLHDQQGKHWDHISVSVLLQWGRRCHRLYEPIRPTTPEEALNLMGLFVRLGLGRVEVHHTKKPVVAKHRLILYPETME